MKHRATKDFDFALVLAVVFIAAAIIAQYFLFS
jgi:hypothetical protein